MAALWDRLEEENETPKAFHGFQIYLHMPPNERSLARVSAKLGHKAKTTVEGWSRRFRWRERVAAYDEYQAAHAIEVRKATLSEAQQALMQQWQLFDIGARDLLNRALRDLREKYEKEGEINPLDLQRLVDTAIKLDTASRRNLGLPTSYKTETIEEPNLDEEEFYVG